MTGEEIKRTAQELLQRPYTMVIRGDPVDGYLAKAPELPGCFTAGETPEEALELLRDAMALWFASMLAHGEPIPEPEAWAAARQARQGREAAVWFTGWTQIRNLLSRRSAHNSPPPSQEQPP